MQPLQQQQRANAFSGLKLIALMVVARTCPKLRRQYSLLSSSITAEYNTH